MKLTIVLHTVDHLTEKKQGSSMCNEMWFFNFLSPQRDNGFMERDVGQKILPH